MRQSYQVRASRARTPMSARRLAMRSLRSPTRFTPLAERFGEVRGVTKWGCGRDPRGRPRSGGQTRTRLLHWVRNETRGASRFSVERGRRPSTKASGIEKKYIERPRTIARLHSLAPWGAASARTAIVYPPVKLRPLWIICS